MSHKSFRGPALARLAVFCLGTTALTGPAPAATYSVGGGTIVTGQADTSVDNTGTSGGFELQANTTANNDTIAVNGVTINGGVRALDVGGQLASSGSYSVTMHGSSLTGDAGAWFQSVGGLISLDTTGGAANTMSGSIGLTVANSSGNGGVSLNLGADTITGGEAVQAIAQGTGTISIDMAGSTVSSTGAYGIVAQNGLGAITIGGVNGGLAATINAPSGIGILTSNISGNQNITLASSGVINAATGISVQGNTVNIDSFGAIHATGDAITALNGTGPALTVTLESSSVTAGAVVGGNATNVFNIAAGAIISSATFNGNGGPTTLNLTGAGNDTLALSSVSNIASLQMLGSGVWTLTGTGTDTGSLTVAGGTLRLGAGANLSSANAVSINGGTFDLNGNTVTIGSLSGGGGTLAIGSGSITIDQASAGSYSGIVTGTGGLTFNGPAQLQLTGQDNHTGPITVNGGTLNVSNTSGSSDLAINGGTFTANFKTLGFGMLSGTGGTLNLDGSFMTFASSANSAFSGVIADPGQGQFTKAGSGTLTLTGVSTAISDLVISGGTLQFGNGGPSGGFPAHSITDNATLIFDRSDNFSYLGNITGTGTLIQEGSGTATVQAGNVTLGSITVSAGTLDLRVTSSLSGNITDNGALILEPGSVVTYGGAISGSGSVTLNGNALVLTGANTYSGGTTISAGTLQLGTPTMTGSLTGNVLDNAKLQFDRSDTTTFAGNISGSGIVWLAGGGSVILTGNNSYTGDTTVFINTNLQAGNGGTTGSLANGAVHVGGGTVTFDRSDSYTFSGSITDAVDGTGLLGRVAVIGSGTTTFTGTNTYSGMTSVNASTLNVTGSIANSSVSVAGGATLTGTGKTGTTTVASGGSLAPGAGTTPGTLSISGNLTLAAGSNFIDAVTPSAAGLASVSGTASINGTVVATVTAGAYSFGQRFSILSAAGGVSGTFASLTGIPISLKGQLSYDANNVYLNLSPVLLAPSLAGNTTINQHNVVAAIDAAVSSGAAVPSGGFNALYGLSGASLNSAIDQISGRIGPNVSSAVGQSFLSFLAMTAEGGAGDAGNFAPGSAYGASSAPHRAQLDPGAMRVWGAAYGGHAGLSGDAASGAAALSASNVGLIGGADMQLADAILAGVTLDWGRQHFNSGNGSGISTDYAFGLYGRADAGPAYVTAAFGYGWHQIATLRVVTVSGTDVLQGKQNADDFGGRIEAGWRMPLDDTYTIAPYGAFAGESFESPAYAETALSGASTFALSYAAHTSTLGRSELGAHLDRNFDLGDGALTADVRAAWAHQLDDLPFTQANFENLATASFQVLGVRPTRDTALLGADLELQYASGLFLGLKGEGQFGTGTTIVEGLGRFGMRW